MSAACQKGAGREMSDKRHHWKLTEDETNIIEGWYQAAASESKTSKTPEMFALLEKLGIPADGMDLLIPDVDHYHEQYREDAQKEADAIKDYLTRHPKAGW
jgi:hypothetical protein